MDTVFKKVEHQEVRNNHFKFNSLILYSFKDDALNLKHITLLKKLKTEIIVNQIILISLP